MRAPPRAALGLIRATAALVLAFFGLGCSVDLAGQNDVAIVAEADAPSATLRSSVASRLALAQIPADVTVISPRSVKVVVHRPLAALASDALEWRGGVRVVTLEEPFAGRAPGAHPADLARAARAERATDRTLVIVGGDKLVWARERAALDGRQVERTSGASLLLRGKAPDVPDGALAALGRNAVHVRATPDGLLLDFGDGLPAYARAYRARLLLSGPTLPALHVSEAAPVPDDRPLAILTVALPALLSLAWLWFVRRFDRAHPEPRWLIAVVFALGAASVVPAALVEWAFGRASPWLNPTYATLGGQPSALPLSIGVFSVVVGVTEEGAKLLAALFAARRREFDEPVDGIVYATASSLGFAALENVSYFAQGRLSPALVCARAFMTVPAHVFFAAIWGYALGARILHKRRILLLFFVVSALAHGAFDALLSTEGTGLAAVALVVGLGALFISLVRRSLRFGIVTARGPVRAAERALFPTGKRTVFVLAWAGFALSAFALFVLGAIYQANRERGELVVVLASAAFVLAIGACAWLVTRTIPLDVVLDDEGVTFAGARRAWAEIRGHDPPTAGAIELRCERGDLTLGPAAPAVLAELARALDARRPAR